MGFVAHDLGVDLGTSNTLVYVKHKGIMISEPTIVVVDAGFDLPLRSAEEIRDWYDVKYAAEAAQEDGD